jgi:hypothetical protein
MIHYSINRHSTLHLLPLDFDKVKECLQKEIDEMKKDLENKKQSHKATVEKLKEAKKSFKALKKDSIALMQRNTRPTWRWC